MELIRRDWRDGYVYDPIIKGYDTAFFASITGTPAKSGNNIRFNAASAGSFIVHAFADIEFSINVPVKPTAGDSRQFGFKAPASTNVGAAYFDITGAVFSCKTLDGNGNTLSTTVTWNDAVWSAAQIKYRIVWEKDRVQYWVNGAIVATHSVALGSAFGPVPEWELPMYINNANADNMDVAYILVRRAAAIT